MLICIVFSVYLYMHIYIHIHIYIQHLGLVRSRPQEPKCSGRLCERPPSWAIRERQRRCHKIWSFGRQHGSLITLIKPNSSESKRPWTAGAGDQLARCCLLATQRQGPYALPDVAPPSAFLQGSRRMLAIPECSPLTLRGVQAKHHAHMSHCQCEG